VSLNLTLSSIEINEPNTLVSSQQFQKPSAPANPMREVQKVDLRSGRRLGTFNDSVFCRRPSRFVCAVFTPFGFGADALSLPQTQGS